MGRCSRFWRIVPDMEASGGASVRAPVAGDPTASRTFPCSLVGLPQQQQLQWHHHGLLGCEGVEQSLPGIAVFLTKVQFNLPVHAFLTALWMVSDSIAPPWGA